MDILIITIEIYKKYAELQIKAFPSIYSQKLINFNNKNNKIKIESYLQD